MPYAIMRFEKRKGGPASAIEKHHERKKPRYASNPDVDTDRSHLNYHLVEPRHKYYAEIQSRIEQAQRKNPKLKVRRDSVKFIDTIVTAIGNHDEGTGMPVNAVAAALILADKSDVRRSRVRNPDMASFDIHDRVNYSVKKSVLKINEEHTLIKLKLSVDTKYGSVMDYFEIFMGRMLLCRKAAEKLGLQFKLMINEQQLI